MSSTSMITVQCLGGHAREGEGGPLFSCPANHVLGKCFVAGRCKRSPSSQTVTAEGCERACVGAMKTREKRK